MAPMLVITRDRSGLQTQLVLRTCGRTPRDRCQWYREYCEGAVMDGQEDAVKTSVIGQLCLGGREFLKELLQKAGRSTEDGQRLSIAQVQEAVERLRLRARIG